MATSPGPVADATRPGADRFRPRIHEGGGAGERCDYEQAGVAG